MLLINLASLAKTEVGLTVENVTILAASKQQEGQTQKTHSSKLGEKELTREEYHLTAKNGNLNSHTILLNGKELTVNSTGSIPSLDPVQVNMSSPIIVAPFSIVFVHIPNIHLKACT